MDRLNLAKNKNKFESIESKAPMRNYCMYMMNPTDMDDSEFIYLKKSSAYNNQKPKIEQIESRRSLPFDHRKHMKCV